MASQTKTKNVIFYEKNFPISATKDLRNKLQGRNLEKKKKKMGKNGQRMNNEKFAIIIMALNGTLSG